MRASSLGSSPRAGSGTRFRPAFPPATRANGPSGSPRSFFIFLHHPGVLARMPGPGADVREAERLEQLADVALVIFNAEALGDGGLKVDPPPAHDSIDLRIGAGLDDRRQFGQLRLAQPGLAAAAMQIEKPVRAL